MCLCSLINLFIFLSICLEIFLQVFQGLRHEKWKLENFKNLRSLCCLLCSEPIKNIHILFAHLLKKKKINPDVFYLNNVMVLLGLLLQLVLGRLVLRLTQQKHQPAQNNRRQILCRRGPLARGGGGSTSTPQQAQNVIRTLTAGWANKKKMYFNMLLMLSSFVRLANFLKPFFVYRRRSTVVPFTYFI